MHIVLCVVKYNGVMSEEFDFISDDKPLILIVDDLLNNLQVLGNILIENGYEISMATGGPQALEMIETIVPDLILLDIMMPEMSGYEVCRKLKENHISSDIPVIFLTAKNETEDIVEGFEAGGIDFITKPFNSSELLARVNTYLQLKKQKDLISQINFKLRHMNNSRREFMDNFFAFVKDNHVKVKEVLDSIKSDVADNPSLSEKITEVCDLNKLLDQFIREQIKEQENDM